MRWPVKLFVLTPPVSRCVAVHRRICLAFLFLQLLLEFGHEF